MSAFRTLGRQRSGASPDGDAALPAGGRGHLHRLPGQRESLLTPLALVHLAFLIAGYAYVVVVYPGSLRAAWAVALAGFLAEIAPQRWRRYLFGEFLLLASAAFSFPSQIDMQDGPFQGWLHMILLYWVLIPSRLGMVRWLLSLVILELLVLGKRPDMGMGPPCVLIPYGIAALLADTWLRAVPSRAVSRVLRWPDWRIAGRTVGAWAVVVGLSLGSAPFLLSPHLFRPGRLPHLGLLHHGSSGISDDMELGDERWMGRDPAICAELIWHDKPLLTGMVYLRSLALPSLTLRGNKVFWSVDDSARRRDWQAARIDPHRWALVRRAPGGGDAVIHPDGCVGTELGGLIADGDGNLFVIGLHWDTHTYRVGFDRPVRESHPENVAEALILPPDLSRLPWPRQEESRWRSMGPVAAAQAIAAWLDGRCQYALTNLPEGYPGPAGSLRRFLFGPPADRRGHCQYFASAETIELRRCGYPARCVIGYASDEAGAHGVIFRGLHAHAWVEFLDPEGDWTRIDPTPPQSLALRVGNLTPDELPAPAPAPPLPDRAGEVSTHAWAGWVGGAIGLMILGALGGLWLRRRWRGPEARLRAELEQRALHLYRLAQSVGERVGPQTTLTEVASALHRRSGIDLTQHLACHLWARFGGGPPPPPWPLRELKAALRSQA